MYKQFCSTALMGMALTFGLVGCDSTLPTEDLSAQGMESRSGGATTSAMRGDECRGTVGAISVEKVIVPSGASCVLQGTRVKSDVELKTNSSVRIEAGARVGGNVKAANSNQVVVLNTHVDGNIQTDNTVSVLVRDRTFVGGNIQLKQGGTVTVENNTVDGDIQFESNTRAIQAASNQVGGNFQVFKNTGGVNLVSNRIAQNLQCKENRPAPTGGGNIAGKKEDQCARL